MEECLQKGVVDACRFFSLGSFVKVMITCLKTPVEVAVPGGGQENLLDDAEE